MYSRSDIAVASGMGAVIGGEPMEPLRALERLASAPHLICHSAFLIERLGVAAQAPRAAIRAAREQRHLDVAELFAFVCPARFATPTPTGFARSLALDPGSDDAETVHLVAEDLLRRLANRHYPLLRETAENATFLARANWPWAKPVMEAILKANPKLDVGSFATGLNAWDRIEEWEEDGGRAPGRQDAIEPQDARRFLSEILGEDAERRSAQADYAGAATFAFQPRQSKEINNILLAEAGTGLGKTLGYLSPLTSGRRRTTPPSGSRPTRRTCSASSTRRPRASSTIRMSAARRSSSARGARTMSASSTCRRRSAGSPPPIRARRCSPRSSPAGRASRETATWWAAISRPGSCRCSMI